MKSRVNADAILTYQKHFRVYDHKLVLSDGQLVMRRFIVLVHEDGRLQFTDFHRYLKNPKNRVISITSNSNSRATFITQFLNYAFFEDCITSLNNLSIDTVQGFLTAYGMCELANDNELTTRSRETVERCVRTVMDFLELLIRDKNAHCRIRKEDLYREEDVRDKRGRVITRKVPVFDVFYNSSDRRIYRDLPDKAFNLLFNHIVTFHPELLMLVALSAFAGLRPSEACNVRRADSLLGAGIRFDEANGTIWNIHIDLTKEMNLRSDLIRTGGIKKERIQDVPDIFLTAFRNAYLIYMNYISGKPYEADYGPLTVNRQGMAMTYQSYYQKFRDIIRDEMIPIYLSSNDPELFIFGRTLQEHSLSPHVFRHWYTVQLVLSGITNPGVLMAMRGDTSPESALIYIRDKGELEKLYQRVNSKTLDYLFWSAQKKYGGDKHD